MIRFIAERKIMLQRTISVHPCIRIISKLISSSVAKLIDSHILITLTLMFHDCPTIVSCLILLYVILLVPVKSFANRLCVFVRHEEVAAWDNT